MEKDREDRGNPRADNDAGQPVESPVDLIESQCNEMLERIEPPIDSIETTIDAAEALADLVESALYAGDACFQRMSVHDASNMVLRRSITHLAA
jgi:hypothetical protein